MSLLAALHVFSAPAAQANNFGSTSCGGDPRNCVSLGNSREHDWIWEGDAGNQIPGIYTATVDAMDDYEYYTVLNTYPSASNPYDVVITDYTYSSNYPVAWVECLPGASTGGSHPYRWCQPQKLRYNSVHTSFYNTAHNRLSMACHEIGHTVGLRHVANDSSCMDESHPANISAYTSTHDDAHINGYY